MLTVAALVFCAIGLSACDFGGGGDNGGKEEHVHNFVYFPAQDPTCTEDGTIAYYICDICGKYFSEDLTEISDIVAPATGHKWGEWTTITEATCSEEGCGSHTCLACGATEQETFPALGHTLTAHTAAEADCVGVGSIQYWSCDVCGKLYADLNAVTETSLLDTFIAPHGHTFGAWETVREATCTSDGEKVRRCACGYEEREIIHAKGHQISESACTECGLSATAGLNFELNASEDGYICTGWASAPEQGSTDPVDLILPAVYEGLPVVELQGGGEYPFAGDARICFVSFPASVTKIGEGVFEGCSGLEGVALQDGVRVYSGAFANCTGLKSIYLARDVSYIAQDAFSGCTALKKAVLPSDALSCIPKGSIEELYVISGTGIDSLKGFTSLRKLSVADSVTSISSDSGEVFTQLQRNEYGNAYYLGNEDNRYSVLVGAVSKDIRVCVVHPDANAIFSSAFEGCTALEAIKIDADGVTSIGSNVFRGCSSLKAIELPDRLSQIGAYAFADCVSLEEIVFPQRVSSVGEYAFSGCSSLKSVSFSEMQTYVGKGAFAGCTALEVLSVPNVSDIGEDAFSGCDSIKDLTMPMAAYKYIAHGKVEKLTITSGTIHDAAFSYTSSLCEVKICGDVDVIKSYPFDGCGISVIIIEDGVKSIGYAAFRGNRIESLAIPASVQSIEMGMTEHCANLTEITVDPANRNYCDVDGVLFSKDKTTLIAYPAGKTDASYTVPDGVKTIGPEAFYYTQYLERVVVPDGVKEIGGSSFTGSRSLKEVVLPDSLEKIGYSFDETALFADRKNWDNGALYIGKHLVATDDSLPDAYSVREGTLTIGGSAFSGRTSLVSVSLSDTIGNIGSSAFNMCSSLARIEIPDSVEVIEDNAFSHCTALEAVTIGAGVREIGSRAFSDCTGLISLTIPSGIEVLGADAFAGCSGLEEIFFQANDAECDEYGIFRGAGNDEHGVDVVFSDDVERIPSYLFYYMRGYNQTSPIRSVTFGKNVKEIGAYAFYGCNALTDISFPSALRSIGDHAFLNCSSLKEINLPQGFTDLGENAFGNCSSVESVFIPNTIINFGKECFNGSTKIKNASIPVSAIDEIYTLSLVSLTIVGSGEIPARAFEQIPGLSSVQILDGVTGIGEYAFYECNALQYLTIGSDVTSIGDYAFLDCGSLTSITIPDNVMSIGKYAFYGCTSLASITIGNSVTNIGSLAFEGCSSLESATIPALAASYISKTNLKTVVITSGDSIGNSAFCNCTSLTSVTIGNSVTSIENFAFEGCSSLTSMTIPDSVTSIGYSAFKGCSSLTSITIPDDVTSIGNSVFEGCSSLESVTIGSGVTSIGGSVFEGCSSLTSMTIPDSVTSIGYSAFEGCSSLEAVYITDIAAWCGISFSNYSSTPLYCAEALYLNDQLITQLVIPDDVTSIGDYAFYHCSSLESVTIGRGITGIGRFAFEGCSSLTSVTFENTSGWQIYALYTETSGTSISESDLADPSIAATYLKSTYYNYYWKRG